MPSLLVFSSIVVVGSLLIYRSLFRPETTSLDDLTWSACLLTEWK